MRTTQIPCTKVALLALLAIFVAPLAHAQNQLRPASHANKLEWPRTFSGQPDFLFTRDEAMTEARARAAREKEPLPLTPSLKQLIEDDSALDPLGINKVEVTTSTATDISGTDVSETDIVNTGQTLMERLMAQAVDLPTVTATGKPDLTEFSRQLNATISSTIARWQPSAGRYNFEAVINGLVLQAIVTSPVKYAVINQQRYEEGETFRITVPMSVPDAEIQDAMRTRMPVSGTLPESLMKSYDEVYKTTLDNFNFYRNKNPAIGQQTLVLPVRITSIAPRQVMLDVNGQSYALTIRYAY